ncbi:MAG: hypothetical protein ACR2NP_02945, partial [Pirellulaceae bacterium]
VPENKTTFGKALNVVLGLTLYYALRTVTPIVAEMLRETVFFWPWLLLVYAAWPLVIFTLTPWVTARILAPKKSSASKR